MKTEGLDVVIPYRRSNSFDKELRYALRSINNLHGIRKVFIIGEAPDWLGDVEYIKMVQGGQKGTNTRNALIRACTNKDVTDNFILMADDIYITKPMDEIKLYHGGSLKDFLAKFNARFAASYYTKKIRNSLAQLPEDAKHYELHVPMVVNKASALSLLANPDLHGLMFRTLYGNMVENGAGEQTKDVKYYARSPQPWFKKIEIGFLSSDDSRFKGEIEEYLKVMFPDKCQYEKWR